MEGLITSDTLITLIVDNGEVRTDLAFPTGITLKDALEPLNIGRLTPFTTAGVQLSPGTKLGRDIASGSLILLRAKGWAGAATIRPIDRSAQVRADGLAALINVLSIIVGTVSGTWALANLLGSTVQDPLFYGGLSGALAVFGILIACRQSTGRPLLEVFGPAAMIFGAAAMAGFANPGDHTHQVFITSALGISLISLLRWLAAGKQSPAAGNAAIDMSMLALLVGLIDVGVMALGQPIQLTGAIIFGLCPPLLAAISGFSIRVSSDVLLDSESVIREAPAVRTPPKSDDVQPSIPLLLAISTARNRLWASATCLGLVATAPLMLSLLEVPGWRGTIALFAVLSGVFACLLIPRSSSSMFIRILPRLAVAAIVLIAAISGSVRFDTFTVALAFAGIAFLFLVATLLMREDRRFYGFARAGDILQSLSVAFSLPLSMAAIGIVSLIRTGGLG